MVDEVDNQLRSLIASGAPEQQVRSVVNDVFRDEAVAMRQMILAVSRGKINMIHKLMQVGDAMADTFTDDQLKELKQEFKDEPLPERIRMFKSVIDSIMVLSASSRYVLDLEAALQEFERMLVPSEASTDEKQLFKEVMQEIIKVMKTQAQDVSYREVTRDAAAASPRSASG